MGALPISGAAHGAIRTQDIGHGEMIRAGGDCFGLPWRMGLLTQTNSPC
ncbi:hypothetical protein P8605_35320 [Streptomyces sp. T-3]|nr:hypothetical protein [Streptomyces sp. T-3]